MKLLTMTLFAVGMAACTVNPPEATKSSPLTADVGRFHLEPAAPSSSSSSPATADETSDGEELLSLMAGATDPSADAIGPRANCSIVQFCNAPGSDGTRCLQQGCTIQQAFQECVDETAIVCGRATCPWIFVASDGSRGTITPCP